MHTEEIESWKGRTWVSEDVLSERLVAGFRATLQPYLAPVTEDYAPLGSHWCLFPTEEPMHRLSADGHPKSYPHLPPPPLPRRMWAGGQLELVAPLRVGERVRRVATVTDICRKEGRSGELWFVTVEHDYSTVRGMAIRERQDIVYRAPVDAGSAAPSRSTERPVERVLPTVWRVKTPPTLLFRYSAITFNAHRIHYDLPYATKVEGYKGLVVHAPLLATLLLNAAAQALSTPPGIFSYRGLSPALAGFELNIAMDSSNGHLQARSAAGLHMEGRAWN